MCGEMNHEGTKNTKARCNLALRRFFVTFVPSWLSLRLLPPAVLALATSLPTVSFAALAVRQIQVAPLAAQSSVPLVTAQGRSLAPQAVSAVDISADGKFITVGTMAFSHDANVWLFASDGTVKAKRNVQPWAPLQVGALGSGTVLAAGLAYSRVTSPEPVVIADWYADLFSPRGSEAFPDSRGGEFSRLRYGEGDWRTGWFASHFGELFVRGPDWLFQPPNRVVFADNSRLQLRFEDKNLLPTHRAMRMAANAGGREVAFGWLCMAEQVAGLPHEKNIVSLWRVERVERRGGLDDRPKAKGDVIIQGQGLAGPGHGAEVALECTAINGHDSTAAA